MSVSAYWPPAEPGTGHVHQSLKFCAFFLVHPCFSEAAAYRLPITLVAEQQTYAIWRDIGRKSGRVCCDDVCGILAPGVLFARKSARSIVN